MNFYNVLMKKQEGVTHFERLFMKYRAGGGATEKELEGVPPLTFKANGEPLISWTVYGNMSQTGTPTPSSPIYPSETGDKTANLLDFTALENAASGIIDTSNCPHVLELTLEANQEYTCISNGTGSTSGSADDNRSIYFNNSDATNVVYAEHPVTVTTGADGKIKIGFFSSRANAQQYITGTAQVWLIKGSTALPYIPYGYKLDIKSGNTTTPVYLGEVQSERNIKKLVLTGEENWQRASNGAYYVSNLITDELKNLSLTIMCSHFMAQNNVTGTSSVLDNKTALYAGASPSVHELYIAARNIPTTADFKTYLQQQYSAGTPVTVWYVLATPTTGIVNEPIRKIGDYADSISNVAEIPTSSGSNTLDVETTLKPSNVYIKYKG